jgi:hypothetical protein
MPGTGIKNKLNIMKQKLFTIGLLIIISLSLTGQNFISTNRQWNVRLLSFMSFTTEIYIIQGDSILNSMSYKKIWMTHDSTLSGLMYQGLLREENNVVYYVPPNNTEGILYDFNLEVGDTTYVKNMFCGDVELEAVVTSIDTVEYFGVERNRWYLESDGWTEYWLDGIGSLSGPLHSFYPLCIICPVWELLCFHENDELLYILYGEEECFQTSVGIDGLVADATCKISPNPVRQGQHFEFEPVHDINSIDIYNSAGILVKHLDLSPNQRVFIKTDDMKPGLYLLKAKTRKNKIKTIKLLVF